MGNITKNVDPSLLQNQEALLQASETQLAALYSDLKTLVIATLSILIITVLALLLGWSLSRGLIYTKILKKKFNWDFFKRFVGLNVIISIIFIILLLIISALVQTQIKSMIYAGLIILVVLIYYITIIYIQFTKTKKIFASIGEGLSKGTKIIPKLIIPLILILLVGIGFNLISKLLILMGIPQSTYITILLLALYLAWARLYLLPEVNKLI